MNEDLIGKEYRNGPDGDLMRVVSGDPDERFVISEFVSKPGLYTTGVADFVRKALED